MAALKAEPEIVSLRAGVFDGPPPGARYPYLAIAETAAAGWGAKGLPGRELRLAVTAWDDAGPARLHALMAAAERGIEAIAREGAGWRIASLAFLRSRVVRDADGPWAGLVEYRVRVVATE
ncbi:DUF3168 domain-containing protein [Sphingomonas sp. 1P06PA]